MVLGIISLHSCTVSPSLASSHISIFIQLVQVTSTSFFRNYKNWPHQFLSVYNKTQDLQSSQEALCLLRTFSSYLVVPVKKISTSLVYFACLFFSGLLVYTFYSYWRSYKFRTKVCCLSNISKWGRLSCCIAFNYCSWDR